jgi:hypothetical protein
MSVRSFTSLLSRADAGIPRSLSVAIAVGGAFVALGADMFDELHLHQFLGQNAYPLP